MTRLRPEITRIALPAAMVLALVVVALLVLGGGTSYRVDALFADAGQLVKGNEVKVGGRPVGTVKAIELTSDNQARVELTITDESVVPLHVGSTARIRTIGLSGVANRFIDLSLGPQTQPEIEDGGVLDQTRTRTIVDLDQVLNELDDRTRAQLQKIFKQGAAVFAGQGAEDANRALAYLDPAFGQLQLLTDELTRDTAAFEKLITTSATTVGALASRRTDLDRGITSTASTLRSIAGQREALASVLDRAPTAFARAERTFREFGGTLTELRPTLRAAGPAVRAARPVLRDLAPTGRGLRSVVADLREIAPPLAKTLQAAPGLARVAVPALASTTSTLRGLQPIVEGIRPYGPDVVAGLFGGLAGYVSAGYDANGHYARISPLFGGAGTPGLLGGQALNVETNRLRRCPGAAAPRAPDGSSPVDVAGCDPKQVQK